MDKQPIEITGIMWHGFENGEGKGSVIVEVEYQGKWIVLTEQVLRHETVFSEIMEPAGILRLASGNSDDVDPMDTRRGK